jgi:MFS family permease
MEIMSNTNRNVWRAIIPAFFFRSEAYAAEHRALRLYWVEGLLQGVSSAFVHTFLPLYALAFGATATELGLMVALSHLLAPLHYIGGAYLAERSLRHKRIYVLLEGLLGRGVVFLYLLVPFFFQGQAAVWVLIGLFVVRMTFFRLGEPSRVAVTGRVVPEFMRGRFMSARSLATSLGQLGIQPLAGVIIAAFFFPRGYQYSFLLAYAAGLAAAVVFALIPVPPPPPHETSARRAPLSGLWASIRDDGRFRAFLAMTLAWGLADQVTASFYSVQMVRKLSLDASAVGFLAASATAASLVGLPLFGHLSDRHGNRSALVIAGLILSFARLPWLFAHTSWQLLPLHLITGLAASSFQVISLNLLLSIARSERHARYSALQQAVGTTMSVVGPLLGAFLFERLGFGSNLVLAWGMGILAMAVAWRYVDDRGPQVSAAPR